MAKYELSDEQVKQLINIISAAQIRGADAPAVLKLAQALQQPLVDKPRSVVEAEKVEVK